MENGQRTRQRRDNQSSPGDIPPDQLSIVGLKIENRGASAGIDGVRKWGALISVAFGAFMAPLDSSIVNTVLPIIAREFGADVLVIEWVILAYLLSLSSLLLIGGRLGDLFGDKRLYVSGFALFTLSSIAGATTRSPCASA